MENSQDFFPGMDPQTLLRNEVQLLARRVDALIKWTEEFEEGVIFLAKKDANNKEEKSNFESAAGNEIPSLVMAEKLDEKEEGDPAPEESQTNQVLRSGKDSDGKEDMDLFGASCSFGELKGDVGGNNSAQTKMSLLEWD